LAWALRVGEAIIEEPVLPWPGWGVLTAFAYVVWVTFTFLFCHQVLRPVSQRVWALAWLCLASGMGVICLALLSGQPWGWGAWTAWLGVLALWSLGYSAWYVWRAWCQRRLTGHVERWVIAGALSLAVLAGVRELIDVTTSSDFYGESSAARYTSLLFGMAFIYIVVHRFRLASTESRDLTVNLTQQVAQRELALAVSYADLEQLAREQSRTAERTRILRDMHDGVGAHISTAIRQLESGRATQGDVLHTLRDSLDQLKLSIDAMNLPAGDLTALLANLRYRLEPRLKASDIELIWRVDELPPLASLDDKAMRHLQYMVFEAMSNVLQHARASVLVIDLRRTLNGGAQLQLIDNGCGFDPDRVKRRGLSSLRERAAALGARLEIASVPGKTVVEIVLDGPVAG
jgi:signal transduction histidine kinase